MLWKEVLRKERRISRDSEKTMKAEKMFQVVVGRSMWNVPRRDPPGMAMGANGFPSSRVAVKRYLNGGLGTAAESVRDIIRDS